MTDTDLRSRAYFEARLALIDQPDVRLFIRDGGLFEHHDRPDLFTLYAERRAGALALPLVCAASVHDSADRGALRHIARALARRIDPDRHRAPIPGSELYAAQIIKGHP